MSKKSIILIALLIITPIIIYFLWPSDESRIRKLFREGAKAVEMENIEEVMSKVSFSYSDDQGLSYLLLKDGFKNTFSRMDGFMIEYEIKKIEIKDKTATVQLDLRVIATYGQDTGYIIGDAARPAEPVFSLEKERAKWLVTSTGGLPLYF